MESVQFNVGAQTQGSQLKVVNPTADKVYTCKVHYDGDEITSKTAHLNIYGRSSGLHGFT